MSTKDTPTPPPENIIPDAEIIDANDDAPAGDHFNDDPDTLNLEETPDLGIMPTTVFLLAVIFGLVINWIIPVPLGRGWGAIGFLLIMLSGAGIYWCKTIFDDADTHLRPSKPTMTLVTEGPYQYSRNPVYVLFLICYAGLALMAAAPIMLICLIGFWYALDKYIVEKEELYLAGRFGEPYIEYASRVGRWVGARSR